MIADYEGDITKLFEGNEDGELPLLATRNLVLFPGVVSPVLIGRTSSLNLINYLKETPEQAFAVFCQKNADEDNPNWYCSELVWAAYYSEGINLNGSTIPNHLYMPDELASSSKLTYRDVE